MSYPLTQCMSSTMLADNTGRQVLAGGPTVLRIGRVDVCNRIRCSWHGCPSHIICRRYGQVVCILDEAAPSRMYGP
jgi:hypothetical protein